MQRDGARFRFIIAIGAAVILLFLGSTPRLQAATLTVTTLDDSGTGSLRQAIIDANASSGADVIDFDVTGTITLASSLPSITGALDIMGPGETVLSVSGNDVSGIRPFTINAGSTTTISGLTIEKGYQIRYGGGINNTGTLTVTNSTIRDNFGRAGGGIYSSGTLTVTNSTIIDNDAQHGGGIGSFAGSVSITNSTVSGNTASGQGGGMVVNVELTLTDSVVSDNELTGYSTAGGGIVAWGTTTLINTTVSGNIAMHGAGMRGGGTVTLINSHVDHHDHWNVQSTIRFHSGTLTLDDSSTIDDNYGWGIQHASYGGEMTLNGGTVSGNRFGIFNGAEAVMTVNGTTVSENYFGIYNTSEGDLRLNDTAVIDNLDVGIHNQQVTSGFSTMTLNRVTVSGNGNNGINNRSTMTVTNSTVNGNTGHGIVNQQTCRPTDSICLDALVLESTSNTLTGNTGSGIFSNVVGSGPFPTPGAVGRVELVNTIVAGNGAADCAYPTTVNSSGYNLDGDGTCNLGAPAPFDQSGTTTSLLDPMLGPLQDNGGPTETHALLTGSPAIDAGTCINPTDQRGIARPQGAACDIGAYEYEFGGTVAPVVTLNGPNSANDGDTESYSFNTSGPVGVLFTLVDPDCGLNGTPSNSVFDTATGAGSFDCMFSNGPNTSDVSVQVAVSGGAISNIDTITVTIAVPIINIDPVAALDGPGDANEGETSSYSFTTFDPDEDAFALVGQGCGLNAILSAAWFDAVTGSGGFDCTFLDGSGTSDVSVQVADSENANSNVDTITVTVDNVAPTVGAVVVPTDPVNVDDQPINVSADFSDPAGASDVYACKVDYGDGSGALDGVVAGTSCTGDHIYAAPGVYTVSITVTDGDGGTGSATATTSVVIYDPAAGFVTGGGWIDSPAGADFANPEASGKATFGFVAKYKKGATTPSGNTQFQFKAGRLNFHVDSYQWLVVGDGLARFKGIGAIKGEGSFDFLITVTDGALEGGDADKFRLQIFGRYDNGAGQELGKGSIVIHAK